MTDDRPIKPCRWIRPLAAYVFACSAWLSLSSYAQDLPITARTSGQSDNRIKFHPGNTAAPGLSVEVMQAVQRIDPTLKFVGQDVLRPLRRVEAELVAGKLDVFFGLVRNSERAAKHLVLSPPLYRQFTQLAVRSDDPINIKTFDEIRQLGSAGIIGVPRGSAHVEHLNGLGGLTVDDGVASVSSTLQKLIAGRVRFVFYGGAVLRKYIQEDGLEGKVRLLPARFYSEDVCVMVSKAADPQLVLRIERALERLRTSGEMAAIQDKYEVRGLPINRN
nr:transporter substrate-binding domain-containing protein [uncultured Roseateles sp.]